MHVIFVSINQSIKQASKEASKQGSKEARKQGSKEASAGTTRAGHVVGVFRAHSGTWLATTHHRPSRRVPPAPAV